jgi:hypothetical protein
LHRSPAPRTAEEFFEKAREDNPSRYAEVSRKYSVQSEYRKQRDKEGGRPRKWYDKAGGVPKSMKRRMDAEEWLAFRKAKSLYRKEWEMDYAFALELANEGM